MEKLQKLLNRRESVERKLKALKRIGNHPRVHVLVYVGCHSTDVPNAHLTEEGENTEAVARISAFIEREIYYTTEDLADIDAKIAELEALLS